MQKRASVGTTLALPSMNSEVYLQRMYLYIYFFFYLFIYVFVYLLCLF